LAYLFIIRKSPVSKLTVSRVFIAGLLVAGFILNVHSNPLLYLIKTWVSPLLEVMIVFIIGRKFYVANQRTRKAGKNNIDFLAHCRIIMQHVTGNEKAGNIISSEIAVLYYAFIARKYKNIDYKSKFTSYKENGILLLLGTFLSLFLIETTGVHLLLSLWNRTIAWTLTALSFYTCIQLYAHIKAIKTRPIILSNDTLEIQNGFAGDASIKYNAIKKIDLSNKIPDSPSAIKIALIQGIENHNCIIYLKESITVTKMFGIKRRSDTILFFVDKPKDFLAALNIKLNNLADEL